MVEFWIIIVALCLLIAAGGALLLALRTQYRSLDNSRQEREAWQQAQEGRQRMWEVRQGKHILDAEKKLADQLKDARREWRDWSIQVQEDHQEWREGVDLEKELARLPHVEHIELAHQTLSGHLQPKDWHPPTFYKSDLRGRDLSYRYLERADLRETLLTEANLYMADLTGASLTGANLQQASLIGTNLSGTDLRGADLSGADLLVADLHNAVLHGANLAGARNLTPAQLQTAIYDSTTIIDSPIDITLPRIPGVLITPPNLRAAVDTSNQQASTTLNTPNEHEISASSASAEPSTEIDQPAPAVEEFASASASGTTSSEDSVLTADADQSMPAAESEASAPGAEAIALAPENEAPIPGNEVAINQASEKNGGSRRRSNKARQAASSRQTLISKQKGANAEQPDDNHKPATEQPEEEELLPHKIIQLQTRASKTKPLPGTGEQSKGDRPQKNWGNSLTANFNSASSETEDQHAHAN
jgi:uncharacterized protein YjbI with pentapeptide repeats